MNKEVLQSKLATLKKNQAWLENKMKDLKKQSSNINEFSLSEPELTKLKRFLKNFVKELR